MEIQLSLFSEEEFLEGEALEQQKAKVYVAKNIYRCSGLRGFIKRYLKNGDKIQAFKVFDDAFKNYGFSEVGGYAFCSYIGSSGEIRYFYQGEEKIMNVTSKELFNILLENI